MLCHCRALGLAIHGVYLPSAATTERLPPKLNKVENY